MEHCGKTVFFKNGRFWIEHENGRDCVLLDLSGLKSRDGSRGTSGAAGPAGPAGGFVPAVTDPTLTGDGSALDPLGLPYKIYVALLNQSGVSAPVATILENTIGPIVWTRTGAGAYTATLIGAFTLDKTTVQFNNSRSTTVVSGTDDGDGNSISIGTGTSLAATSDDNMYNNTIEIRVYP